MSEAYTISPEQLTGLILAGGQGRRMGTRNKGLIDIAGRPLVDYAADLLKPYVQRLLVCSNDQQDHYQSLGYSVIDDGEFARQGPLAGILAGIRATKTPWLAIIPCDQLTLPEKVYPALAKAATQCPVGMAVACDKHRMHPTCAVIKRNVGKSLQQRIVTGELKAGLWFEEMNAARVVFEDVEFINLNTPKDLNRFNQTG